MNPTQNRQGAHMIVAAAILIQTLLGSVYAWSVFVPSLMNSDLGGLTAAQTQVIFGVMIAAFAITMVPAGRILEKVGPRPMALISGLLYGGGYVGASFSGGEFIPLVMTIGLLSGTGIGCGYVCALSICIRWFPERKGFITGLAVAGFGGGAIIVSTVGGVLLSSGVGVLQIFLWLGILAGGGILLAALLLRFPVRAAVPTQAPGLVASSNFARSAIFWIASGGIFAGTFAGLLIVGNLKPIGLAAGLELPVTVAAISGLAIGNTVGRMLWGWIYDRFGFFMLPLSLALLGISVVLLVPAAASKFAFLALTFAVGIGFGSCFVLYAALIATHFGPERVGLVYPWVFLFYGVAALLGPVAGGMLYDVTGSFSSSILLASIVSWVAAGVLLFSGLALRAAKKQVVVAS